MVRRRARMLRQVAVSGSVVTLILGCAVAAGAVGPTWTTSTIPWTAASGIETNGLLAVSCGSETLCVAISQESPTTNVTVYNGTNWTTSNVPVPARVISPTLFSVSCSTAMASCAAVGYAVVLPDRATGSATLEALIDTYSDTTWTATLIPLPPGWTGSTLSSVSCTTTCVALGDVSNAATSASESMTVTGSGPSWSVLDLGDYGATDSFDRSQISCVTASWCEAVDTSSPGAGILAETFNGSSWSGSFLSLTGIPAGSGNAASFSCSAVESCLYSVPSLEGDVAVTLADGVWTTTTPDIGPNTSTLVSCAPSTTLACLAVDALMPIPGSSVPALVTGDTDVDGFWSQTTVPTWDSVTPSFASVSCVSATWCMAVGGTFTQQPLVAIDENSHWELSTLPSFSAPPNSLPTALSCTSSTACTVIGTGFTGAESDYELSADLDRGGWSVEDASPTTGAPVALSSISCAASTCVAVGDAVRPAGDVPFIESSAGGVWTTAAVALPAGDGVGQLAAVSCPSPGRCVAVGATKAHRGSSIQSALVATERNGAWTTTTLPHVRHTAADELVSVSCVSSRTCVAVGSATWRGRASGYAAVLSRGVWTASLHPAQRRFAGKLMTSVSCASATRCTAVVTLNLLGAQSEDIGFETWNGRQWSPTEQLNVPNDPTIASISCPTATTCVAVGSVFDTGLVAVQTSTGWTTSDVLASDGSAGDNNMESVSCWAPDECRAVGFGPGGAGNVVIDVYLGA